MFAIPLRAYMSQVESSVLLKTPLHARHVALGARMVPFGGWDMPVEYSGITDEHMAVRTARRRSSTSVTWARSRSPGKDALAAVQRITSNDAAKLKIGQTQYSGLMTAGRHVRRRSARLPAWPTSTSCWSSTPRTSPRTSPGSREHIAGVGDAVAVELEQPLRARSPCRGRRRARCCSR